MVLNFYYNWFGKTLSSICNNATHKQYYEPEAEMESSWSTNTKKKIVINFSFMFFDFPMRMTCNVDSVTIFNGNMPSICNDKHLNSENSIYSRLSMALWITSEQPLIACDNNGNYSGTLLRLLPSPLLLLLLLLSYRNTISIRSSELFHACLTRT